MKSTEIIEYYDHLMRLATSKCTSRTEAEDLVGDTMLAAFAYIHGGGTIEYPKTWLTNTLYHKHNDNLRKKYHSPITVCLDERFDIAQEGDEEYLSSDEAAKVRKELNHLAYITREVMVRFYFGSQSVADIAEGLEIPEGTVKSRLSAGRAQMRKGLETMETRENYLPGKLSLTFGGSDGLKGEPMSLVEGDLIAQNLLILAYEKPLTTSELSKAIGIPAAYIEPIIRKLIDGELMVQNGSGKVYTDFIITKPQNTLKNFKPQLDFAHKHFDTVWGIIEQMSDKLSKFPFVKNMGDKEKTKLERYAVLMALQDFQHSFSKKFMAIKYPKRKDGGRWIARATAFDAGYNTKEYAEASEYMIHGGSRATKALVAEGTRQIWFNEFDTTLWDNPHRYGFNYELYFKHIIPLLWCIYADIPLDERAGLAVPSEIISYLPVLEQAGLLSSTQNKPRVEIPVLKRTDHAQICVVIQRATEDIKSAIGADFEKFTAPMKTPIPKHLTSVPELFRYCNATEYFAMAIIREAYSKGFHLNGVDYCCPPVVMVYDCVE